MSTSRRQRILGALVGTLIPALFVGPLLTTAATPNWSMTVRSAQPATVKNGNSAAWTVTIANGGPSNISSLYLSADIANSPTYISSAEWSPVGAGPSDPCNAAGSGPLYCAFGDLRAGESVTLTIAFATPSTGSGWSFKFRASANGSTPSDRKGTSRGDYLEGTATVALNSNRDFAGGFTLDAALISTDPNLSRSNPQSSGVLPPRTLIGVTIEDGIADYPGTDDPCATYACFGEWTKLSVGDGGSYAPFKVVLTIRGASVPGGLSPEDMNVYHDGDGVIGDEADERCASENDYTTNGGAPCVFAKRVGNNYQLIVWLTHNGSLRGAF